MVLSTRRATIAIILWAFGTTAASAQDGSDERIHWGIGGVAGISGASSVSELKGVSISRVIRGNDWLGLRAEVSWAAAVSHQNTVSCTGPPVGGSVEEQARYRCDYRWPRYIVDAGAVALFGWRPAQRGPAVYGMASVGIYTAAWGGGISLTPGFQGESVSDVPTGFETGVGIGGRIRALELEARVDRLNRMTRTKAGYSARLTAKFVW